MPFRQAYRLVEPCVVAVAQKFHLENQDIPNILGTGWFVSEHGVIATCQHVVDAAERLPRQEGYAGYPFQVLLWQELMVQGTPSWVRFDLDVVGVAGSTFVGGRPTHVSEQTPDLAFLLVNVRGTPLLPFDLAPVEQGEQLAFVGYPMGLHTLRGAVGLRQESPSLHTGFVSAINPNRLAPSPYSFRLHANTQGGASGSPVIRPSGEVVGMLYSFIPEYYEAHPGDPNTKFYEVPTALSGCISGRLIAQSAALANARAVDFADRPFLQERIANGIYHTVLPGEPIMEPYTPE